MRVRGESRSTGVVMALLLALIAAVLVHLAVVASPASAIGPPTPSAATAAAAAGTDAPCPARAPDENPYCALAVAAPSAAPASIETRDAHPIPPRDASTASPVASTERPPTPDLHLPSINRR